jgi:hypothetical protein
MVQFGFRLRFGLGASQFLASWQLPRQSFRYSNVAVPLTPRRGRPRAGKIDETLTF